MNTLEEISPIAAWYLDLPVDDGFYWVTLPMYHKVSSSDASIRIGKDYEKRLKALEPRIIWQGTNANLSHPEYKGNYQTQLLIYMTKDEEKFKKAKESVKVKKVDYAN